jgi:protein subunit release factor A
MNIFEDKIITRLEAVIDRLDDISNKLNKPTLDRKQQEDLLMVKTTNSGYDEAVKNIQEEAHTKEDLIERAQMMRDDEIEGEVNQCLEDNIARG